MTQISNLIYCSDFLTKLDIKTKLLANPYYDFPFLIIENFIDEKICKEINRLIDIDNDYEKAQVLIADNIITSKTVEDIRKTKIYALDNFMLEIYQNKFLKHQKTIEDYFKLAITSSTEVQVLEYPKGCFYSMHSDDSSMLYKDDELVGFVPVKPERKISTVLFTTTHKKHSFDGEFNGGELLFNFLFDENGNQVKIEPKAGDMVVFLSNPFFTHEVLKVEEGRRITLVQWHNAI